MELEKILPKDGPPIEEVQKYVQKLILAQLVLESPLLKDILQLSTSILKKIFHQ